MNQTALIKRYMSLVPNALRMAVASRVATVRDFKEAAAMVADWKTFYQKRPHHKQMIIQPQWPR